MVATSHLLSLISCSCINSATPEARGDARQFGTLESIPMSCLLFMRTRFSDHRLKHLQLLDK